MNKNIIIGITIVLIALIGGGFFMSKQDTKSLMDEKQESRKGSEVKPMEKQAAEEPMSESAKRTGTILAGNSSPYIEFNSSDYENAKKQGKILFLEFYANWCPICRVQEPKLLEGFTALKRSDVVGFRVNYNDPETDDTEKALAKEFGVTYQHTHVIVKDGKVISKSNDDLEKETFMTLIDSVK